MTRLLRWVAVCATAGMFVVLVMGSTVTNTGSEHGCGRSWPLCHGKFIPQMAASTAIEFSHRAVVSVESVLIIAFAVLLVWSFRDRVEARWLAAVMVLFLFLQAGLGAWAVMEPTSSAALALHFGVSLIAFASTLLACVFVYETGGWERLRDAPPAPGLRASLFGVTAYTYLVVYIGAYVRHTNAGGSCSGWPLCNGAIVPRFTDKVGANFTHRVSAGLLTIAVAALLVWAFRMRRDRPDIFLGAQLAAVFVLLQALSGALVVWTGMDLFAALSHATFVALMFGALTFMCMQVTPAGVIEGAGEIAPPRARRHGRAVRVSN